MYPYFLTRPADRLPPEQRRARNRETVRRARETVRRSAEFELTWQRAAHAMRAWRLTREELNKAAKALGRPPLTDQEWAEIDEHR